MAVSMNVDYTRQLFTGLSTDDWGDVEFNAGDVAYIMDLSECWIFDGSTMQQLPDLGGGGGYTASDWLDPTKPTGRIESDSNINGNFVCSSLFTRRTGETQVFLTEATHISDSFFLSNTGVQSVVGTKLRNVYNSGCNGTTALTKMDMAGTGTAGSIGISAFNNSGLNVLVIRNSVVCSLGNVNAFGGSCPFASGKAGGTLYVPQSLISSYQNATNWTIVLGYTNNQIKAIEGSIYETKYVDGTNIS